MSQVDQKYAGNIILIRGAALSHLSQSLPASSHAYYKRILISC
jgi:hypothetical protein